MFGRKPATAIRSAAAALKAGRLEEALNLAGATELAGEPGAQRLLTELCEALLRRAQEHLIAERFTEALADLDRAWRCGAMRDKVEEWRARALAAMRDREHQKRQQREALEAAQQGLADGALTMAREHLAAVEDEAHAARLAERVEQQERRARAALDDARTKLNQDDIAGAVARWTTARRDYPGIDGLSEAEASICRAATEAARASLAAGRLDRVGMILSQMGEVGRGRGERVDLEQAWSHAQEAARAFEDGRSREADIALGRLAQIVGEVKWIQMAREQVRELEARRTAISEGPLGTLMGPGPAAPSAEETMAAPRRVSAPAAGRFEPERLLLRIDGVGSFLILRGARIMVGRAGSGAVDLPLVADLPTEAAEIQRSGDDYFLIARSEVFVGSEPVRQTLLTHGDRVRIGSRARMTFLRPSLKSATAVLELAPGLRSVTDVRRVILLGGPILLGRSSECHIPMNGGDLVIFERGGGFCVGSPGRAAAPLACGQAYESGGVRLSLQLGDGHVVGDRAGRET